MSISLPSPLSRGPSDRSELIEKAWENVVQGLGKGIGQFRVPKISRFQNEATCKTFLVKMSFICMTKKSFSNQWQGTSSRFEIEALGNPEMT